MFGAALYLSLHPGGPQSFWSFLLSRRRSILAEEIPTTVRRPSHCRLNFYNWLVD